MAITFPTSPTDGQQFTVGARKWIYSTAKAAWLGGTSSLEVGNITGIGTGVAAALANAANATGGIVLAGGTSTLNVNGTVGATTAASGAFTTLSASSPILAPSGSSSAPGYSFTTATNSGMTAGEGGTGRVTLYAGGTLMAYLDQNNSNFGLLSTMKFGWSSGNPQAAGIDTYLLRDSAGVLGLRNGTTNAVGLNAYNTFTNTSNYERAAFNWSSNVLKIGTEKLGTGTARALDIQTDGTARISISSTGATTFTGDVSLTTLNASGLTRIGTATTADALSDVLIATSATTQRGLTIQGKASQTAPLLRIVESTNNAANNGWQFDANAVYWTGSGTVGGYLNQSVMITQPNFFYKWNSSTTNVFSAATFSLGPTVAGSKILAIGNGTQYDTSGGISCAKIILDKTITAGGTTGAVTINKSSGAVNFAAAATSLVVTNSLVTVNSIILISKATNDTTARLGAVVAAAGSFTIYMDVAPVAETRVNFILTN